MGGKLSRGRQRIRTRAKVEVAEAIEEDVMADEDPSGHSQ